MKKVVFISYCLLILIVDKVNVAMAQDLSSAAFCAPLMCPSGDNCSLSTRPECFERYRRSDDGRVVQGFSCCPGQQNTSLEMRTQFEIQRRNESTIRTTSWNVCQQALRDVIYTNFEKNRICYLYQNHCAGGTRGETASNSCMACMPNSPNTLGQVPEKCYERYLAGVVPKEEGEGLVRGPNDYQPVYIPACCQRAP